MYVGANSYIQQYQQWPQIPLNPNQNQQFEEAWIEALLPTGVPRSTWICPSVQRLLGNPNYNSPQLYRADYIGFPFDSKPMTPFRWSNMPWFAEKASVHGNGNLLIFRNGSVQALNDIQPTISGQ